MTAYIGNLGLLRARFCETYDGGGNGTFVNDKNYTAYSDYSGLTARTFDCTGKTLPGLTDAEIWSIQTDNPDETIGRAYVGKPPKPSAFEITVPSDAAGGAESFFESAAGLGKMFAVIFEYNDPTQPKIYYIIVKQCRVAGYTTRGNENSGPSYITVKLQPFGGDFSPVYDEVDR
jgi:hypothetical protein